jgi:hypothetical protein
MSVNGPYVPYAPATSQHGTSWASSPPQPSVDFQQFIMWKQQQEYLQWQQQQQQHAQQQWRPPTTSISPGFSPNDQQYQQFLAWQKFQSQQSPPSHPATPNAFGSYPQANAPTFASTTVTAASGQHTDPSTSGQTPQQQQQQQQQQQPPSSQAVSTSNTALSTVVNAGEKTNVASSTTNNSGGGGGSSTSGCFNPINSLLGLMGVATTTMNNITNTNKKTASSMESMKKAFAGMVDTFQSFGQIAGGCVKL